MSSKMNIKRNCQQCGDQFYAHTLTTRFCSLKCAQRSYKVRHRQKKIDKVEEETNEVEKEAVERLNFRDILMVKEVAKILGRHIRLVYRMIDYGKLKAINLSERKIRIHRDELTGIFEKHDLIVLPSVELKEIKPFTIQDCYHIKEVEKKYGIYHKTLYMLLKRKNVPKMKEGKFIYVPKRLTDKVLKEYIKSREGIKFEKNIKRKKDGQGKTKKKGDQ